VREENHDEASRTRLTARFTTKLGGAHRETPPDGTIKHRFAPDDIAAQSLLASQTMANAVTHFEIFAAQPARLAEFYRQLLGWQIDKAPGIDYWRIKTDSAAGQGINGGLTFRPIPEPHSWVHYLHVESLDHVIEQVLNLGGAVLRPKTAVPKTAWYAVVSDPEGNIFAVWQPDPTAMPPIEPED